MTRAKEIRVASGLSQETFAYTYGLAVGTVKNWEANRATPDTAARILLEVIAKYPQEVAAVVDSMSPP